MIQEVTVSADSNPSYYTSPGKPTKDKIFLLSINEARKYFKADKERACMPTAYAVSNGVNKDENGNCYWWLRSPGFNQYNAALVSIDGSIGEYGHGARYVHNAVRPALWIDLNLR